MALALLRPGRVPGTPGTVAFQLDLGSNRYWQFAIGDDTVAKDRGFSVLGAPLFTSPLLGPIPLQALGRTVLEIPISRFDRDHRAVQVMSFRSPGRDGPAVSDIRKVSVAPRARPDAPPIAFSVAHAHAGLPGATDDTLTMRLDQMETYSVEAHRAAPWRYAEPMGYREVPPMSGAMFLSSLLPAIRGVLGKVAPIISGLLAKAPARATAPAAGGAAPAAGG